MALQNYNLAYYLPFLDDDGNSMKLEIFDRDVSAPAERLKGSGYPVKIYWEGDEAWEKGLIGSSCEITLFGTPELDGTSDLTQFFTDDEERFYVKVSYSLQQVWKTYWTGFIHQDDYTEHITAAPYTVVLHAFDRFKTLSTRLNDIQNPAAAAGVPFYLDDTVPLIDIVEALTLSTKLELDIDDYVGLISENGDSGTGFLRDYKVNLESYKDGGDEEFVKMLPLVDIVDDIAKSLNCRIYQSEGVIKFQSIFVRPLLTDDAIIIPSEIQPIDDNLTARHNPSERTFNLSIQTGSVNLLENPSFEKDAVGTYTSITGWTKPYSGNTWEVSEEAVAEGSNKAIKLVSDRLSQADFENASLATKLLNYTIMSAETKIPIRVSAVDGAFNVQKARLVKLGFQLFVDNNNSKVFTTRYSISMWSEFYNAYKYYDFEGNFWSTNFKYAFIYSDSTGEWQDFATDVYVDPAEFVGVGTPSPSYEHPMIFRLHTHNYDATLSNVVMFYDNFSLKAYSASGDTKSGVFPDTKFFNLSTDEDVETKTGSVDVELLAGITTVDTIVGGFLDQTVAGWQLMDKGALGQYMNIATGIGEQVDYVSFSPQIYAALQTKIQEKRDAFAKAPKTIFSSTLASKLPTKNNGYNDFNLNGLTFGVGYGTPQTGIQWSVVSPPSSVEFEKIEVVTSAGYTGVVSTIQIVPNDNTLPFLAIGSYTLALIGDNLGSAPVGDAYIKAVMKCPTYGTIYGEVTIDRAASTADVLTTYTGVVNATNSGDFEFYVSGASATLSPDNWSFKDIVLYNKDAGYWTPRSFHDQFKIDFGAIYSNNAVKNITRFDFDCKANRYNVDFVNI